MKCTILKTLDAKNFLKHSCRGRKRGKLEFIAKELQ